MWDEIFGNESTRPIDWADAKQVQEAIAAANSGFNAAYQAGGAAQQIQQAATQHKTAMAAQYQNSTTGAGGPGPITGWWNGAPFSIPPQEQKWMWNGKFMTIEEFAQTVYGDTPERTHFLLKHKGRDQ